MKKRTQSGIQRFTQGGTQRRGSTGGRGWTGQGCVAAIPATIAKPLMRDPFAPQALDCAVCLGCNKLLRFHFLNTSSSTQPVGTRNLLFPFGCDYYFSLLSSDTYSRRYRPV